MERTNAGPDDQSHSRRYTKMRDQHGRLWGCEIDIRTGTPVGHGPRPVGWKAPWLPSQEWFRYNPRGDNPNLFRIDYDSMVADRVAAHDAYDAAFTQYAVAHGWDPNDSSKRGVIESVVGKRPLPIEVIKAAMQGNKYVLGLTDVVDTRVVPFLRKKENKQERKLAAMPDFTDQDTDEELEARMDLQDQFQPDDEPRDRAPIKTAKRPKAKTPSVPAA
jgi:hypothetical protein